MEWLNPWALWLMTTLAFPLWLHLKQQSKPKTVDYPSLILLRQGFPQAMQQQRLRDLLQLILRLLLLLCLVLALAQPSVKSKTLWPTQGVLLLDNSVTGLLHHPLHGNQLKAQLAEGISLEGELPDGLVRLPILPEGAISQAEERFGEPSVTLNQWLDEAESHEQPDILILSKAILSRATAAFPEVKKWLAADSRRRLMIWEMSEFPPLQIQNVAWKTDSNFATQLNLSAKTNSSMPLQGIFHWKSGMEKQVPASDGNWNLPLRSNLPLEGNFRIQTEAQFQGPWNTYHFASPEQKNGRILHLGSSWISMPSLGSAESPLSTFGETTQKIEHWPSGASIPSLRLTGSNPTLAIMVAGENLASETLERLAAFVFEGGGLILSLGPQSDITALNSRLLSPLGMGRIGNLKSLPSPQAIRPEPKGYSPLNINLTSIPTHALIEQYFVQEDVGQAEVLWKYGAHAIGIFRRIGLGQVLIWNTDIDSLSWTSLGLEPILPLTHRAFLSTLQSKNRPIELATDSTWTWSTTDPAAKVVDDQGVEFTRTKVNLSGIQIGPFPKAGIYSCLSTTDTTRLAVNLNHPWQNVPLDFSNDQTNPQNWDWKGHENQVIFTADQPSQGMSRQHRDSWPWTWPLWVSAALMLLLLDGLVALILRPRKPTVVGS